MALVYVSQVADYFRKIIDESDSTFIDDADVATFLEIGENEYRQLLSEIDPQLFAISHTVTVADTDEIDLNNILLGTTPTQTRMSSIVRVTTLDANGEVSQILDPVYSYEALVAPAGWPIKWMLQARTITTSANINGDVKITYIPLSTVTWSVLGAPTEYIDDLIPWHDIISLFAARQYFQADGAINVAIENQLVSRKGQLVNFIESGRSRSASRYVSDDDYYV